jgi:hypothetical protein
MVNKPRVNKERSPAELKAMLAAAEQEIQKLKYRIQVLEGAWWSCVGRVFPFTRSRCVSMVSRQACNISGWRRSRKNRGTGGAEAAGA